jgi:flagellar protein FliS
MYATFSPFASPAQPGSVYRKTGVEIDVQSASPHRLVAMLFDGVLESIAQAHGAIVAGNIALKARALRRAVAIVDEGLKSALDAQQGGRLATDLGDLYAYITLRLTQANLHSDVQALEECKHLLQPLQQAWAEIGDRV